MAARLFSLLRNCAAVLIIISGLGQIAGLWLYELKPTTLIDALLGSVYLIIGIGLFGQSRFTLFMAIAVPLIAAWYLFSPTAQDDPIYRARLTVDAMVVAFSLLALWHVRNEPSV